MEIVGQHGEKLIIPDEYSDTIFKPMNIDDITGFQDLGNSKYIIYHNGNNRLFCSAKAIEEVKIIWKKYWFPKDNTILILLKKSRFWLPVILGCISSIYLFRLGWNKCKNDCQDNNTKVEITSDKALVYESCKVLFKKTKYYGKKVIYGLGYATPMVISTIFVTNINKNIIECY